MSKNQILKKLKVLTKQVNKFRKIQKEQNQQFIDFVKKKDLKTLEVLAYAGGIAHKTFRHGLSIAIQNGSIDIVAFLLNNLESELSIDKTQQLFDKKENLLSSSLRRRKTQPIKNLIFYFDEFEKIILVHGSFYIKETYPNVLEDIKKIIIDSGRFDLKKQFISLMDIKFSSDEEIQIKANGQIADVLYS